MADKGSGNKGNGILSGKSLDGSGKPFSELGSTLRGKGGGGLFGRGVEIFKDAFTGRTLLGRKSLEFSLDEGFAFADWDPKKYADPDRERSRRAEAQVDIWLTRVEGAKKREKAWRKSAQEYVRIYEADKKAENTPFNILYSNTETLIPALYNNTPRAACRRRYGEADPLAKAGCSVIQRAIDYTFKNDSAEYAEFDDLANQAIVEALVAGRGMVRWTYEADVIEPEVEEKKEASVGEEQLSKATDLANDPQHSATDSDSTSGSSVKDDLAKDLEIPFGADVKSEAIIGDYVSYDMVCFGYARKWKDCPWEAFEHHMVRAELILNFGEELGNLIKLEQINEDASSGQGSGDGNGEGAANTEDSRKLAVVYEIWDKSTKKVYFVSPQYKDRPLKTADDPLQLSGFFPNTEPLQFQRKISTLTPTAPYELYKQQAEELNEVTTRLKFMVKAFKIRGFYDSTIEGLEEVLKADDNTLIAAENTLSLRDGDKLSEAVWIMPIERFVGVIQELNSHRNNVKQTIYEITGIADILRAQTNPNETATAQTIKNEWGTLRLRDMQKAVNKFSRNNMRIVAELTASRLSAKTLKEMTNLPYPTGEEKQQAQLLVQHKQQQDAMMAQQAAQTGQQPPPPTPLPPEVQQLLDTPSWDDIEQLLKDKSVTDYRIDIETNSTILDEMAEDKKNMGELLQSLNQFFMATGPLVEKGVLPFEAMKSIALGLIRKMSFNPEVEEAIQKMAPPPPPDPSKTDPALAAKTAADQQKAAFDMQMQQLKLQQSQADHVAEQTRMAQQAQLAQLEHEQKMQEIQMRGELAGHTHRLKIEAANHKAASLRKADGGGSAAA